MVTVIALLKWSLVDLVLYVAQNGLVTTGMTHHACQSKGNIKGKSRDSRLFFGILSVSFGFTSALDPTYDRS